jgi:hypothetical protein
MYNLPGAISTAVVDPWNEHEAYIVGTLKVLSTSIIIDIEYDNQARLQSRSSSRKT